LLNGRIYRLLAGGYSLRRGLRIHVSSLSGVFDASDPIAQVNQFCNVRHIT
jgi:hypothetical protein